jgi:hypothetical protein
MGNWFPIGKIGANTTYDSKEACEIAEGQECFDVTTVPSDLAKVIEVEEPVMIEVIKERDVINEAGETVKEQYGELEQARGENGELIFLVVKKVVEDAEKKAAKESEKAAKQAKKAELDLKLVELKDKGSKEIKDLIEILGL